MSNLKNKTISGIKWITIEQISIHSLRFVLGIILSRLLLPKDYGITALIAVFMAISQVFISSGFGNALIQKKNRTEVDYATVFYFNLLVSLICWLGLTLSRNWFATFFNEPLLAKITPVIGLNLIFDALALVQRTRLTVDLNFKTQAKATFIATLFSGIFGIYLAYNGFGVWSLVYQSITRRLLNTVLLWVIERWIPPFAFSISSFKSLFSFGSKIMATGLIETIYRNIYSLIIGKFFTSADLGFYNRANQFKNLPSQNITIILHRVTYPVLCSLQDNDKSLLITFQKFIRLITFCITPIMLWMMVLARPIILVLLKEKWEPSVQLLQILCIVGIMYPINSLNLTILQAKGRSDLFLKLTLIKKVITTIVIFATFSISVKAMILGLMVGSLVELCINTHYTKHILDYGVKSQFRDFMPTIILSIIMVLAIMFSTYFINSNILKIIIGSIIGLVSYFGTAYLLNNESIYDVKDIINHIQGKN